MLRLALTKLVEPVGEAAKQVSSATEQEHPEVPWSAAAKMRDQLVELAGERGDLEELRRLADHGSQDAAEVLAELEEE